MDCIFCQIVRRELPAKILFESDDVLAFPDINPAAQIHIVVVPKRHIKAISEITEADGSLLAKIYMAINGLVKDNNLADGYYRVLVNGGKSQHVPHLHFHLLGGKWNKFI